jgi:hypothetical protein
MDADPFFVDDGDIDAARELVAAAGMASCSSIRAISITSQIQLL